MNAKTTEQIEAQVRGIGLVDRECVEGTVYVYHNADDSWSVCDNGSEDDVDSVEDAVALTVAVVMENRAKLAEKNN